MNFIKIRNAMINLSNVTVISMPDSDEQDYRNQIHIEFCKSVYGHGLFFETSAERDAEWQRLAEALGLGGNGSD